MCASSWSSLPLDPFINALRGQGEISITVAGRRTGRAIALPVWFIHEGSVLYLLPVRGSRTQWCRNLLANPSVAIQCRGQRRAGEARVIRDPQQVQKVADMFRAKYRADQVARYYSVFDVCFEIPL